MTRLILFTMVVLSGLLFSCQKDEEISLDADDFYHLKVDEAYLPLWVRGNTQSGTILLYIQGGPGLPAIDFATVDFPGWKKTIENDVAVAYYDQRGLGNRQGSLSMDQINLSQYVKDIHQIVQFLKAKYEGSKVVLMGHSFGGRLAYHYLLEYGSLAEADGLISIAGPATHDGESTMPERWAFRADYLNRFADLMIDKGVNPEKFEEAKIWLQTAGVIDTQAERDQWNEYVELGQLGDEGETTLSNGVKVIFGSPYNTLSYLNYTLDGEVSDKLSAEVNQTYILDELSGIEVPALIMVGEYDPIAVQEEIEFVFNQLGASQKELVVFPESGHDLYLDRPHQFQIEIQEFVESL